MKKTKGYYLQYLSAFSFTFLILFYFCFAIWFSKYGKSYFRSFDGLDQHYLIFLYIGNLLRDFLDNLLVQHKFVLPLWNMGIGYGADIPTSLAAYLPDPFNWIAVFFPGKYAEKGYSIMLALKVYAAGLAFSCFCFHHEQKRFETLIGSILYMFSGTMYIIFIESFFVNPLYIFPLILIGVDRIWKYNKSAVYVFSLAFAFINYFYFAYMTCILVFFYCLLKYFCEESNKSISGFYKIASRIFLFSIVSLCMASIVVLPLLYVLSDLGRLGVHYYLPFLFDKSYYICLFSGFIGFFSMNDRDCLIGYGSFSLLAVCAFFIKETDKQLKITFIVLTLGLCLPFFGSIMNGFSYTANRWVWAYALCVCYMAVKAIPLFNKFNFQDRITLSMCVLFYIVMIRSVLGDQNSVTGNTIVGLVLVLLVLLYGMNKEAEIFIRYALVAVVFSVLVSSYHFFNHRYANATRVQVEKGRALSLITENPAINLLPGITKGNPNYRYDQYGTGRVKNTSWLYGISGMDFYISIYNGSIDRFHNDLAVLTGPSPMDFFGLNRRTDLEWLFNVKYYLVKKKFVNRLPYGFSNLAGENHRENNTFQAFGSQRANSFVHGFSYAFAEQDFKTLSPYNRQQLLMQGIVLKNGTDKIPVLHNNSVDFSIQNSKKLSYKNGIIKNEQKDGNLTLTFDKIVNSELYLYVEGVDTRDETGFRMDVSALYQDKPIDSSSTSIYTANNKTHMYGNKHKWLICLGLVNDADKIQIRFPKPGTIQMKKILIYAEPVEQIQDNISRLNNLTKDLRIGNNEIRFSLLSDAYPYAFLSIPYSSGWKAFVNGKERDILKANEAFMVIPIQKGDKNVRMKYETPGLFLGAVISLLSVIGYLYYLSKIKSNLLF